MASVSFTRTDTTEIYYKITGGYSSTSYTYEVQVMSNSSYEWKHKDYATVSSSGTASGYISVNDNSNYYCRVVVYYNDSVSSYLPSSSGRLVYAYEEETSYDGAITDVTVRGYYGTEDVPYYGQIRVTVSIYDGAETGWYIQVNNSSANRTAISMSGTYTVGLDNLYDGDTDSYYSIKLVDPDGTVQSVVPVYHISTPTVTHTLFYLANGGSGAPNSQTVTVAAWDDPHYFTVTYSEPTRDGYTFLGWSTSSSASSATYTGGSGIYVSGQTTLYAVWQQNPYTYYLVFDANGGTGAPGTKSVSSYDSYYTFYLSNYSLTSPTRVGYKFVGWGTSSSASTTATSFTAYASSGCSVTAYAIWEVEASIQTPNVTSLTISGVSSSGFSVSATQDNLETGYWVIEISTSSSFGSVIASNAVGYLQRTLSYEFSGLAANTLYYIRIRNYSGVNEASAGTWRRWTGIAAFAWTGNDSGNVAAGVVPEDVITAEQWNLLAAKISQVSVRNGGGSVSLATVYAGMRIMAEQFDGHRDALAGLASAGSVPDSVESGDPMLASQFANATASLKSAINRAISALNS